MNGNFKNYRAGKLDIDKYHSDMRFGQLGEKDVFLILIEKYGNKIHKTKEKYAKMDYYLTDDNDKIIHYFELKNRRVNYGKYPSLCFNKGKLDFANSVEVQTTILFNCLNGLYKWDYNKQSSDEEYFFGDIANCSRNGNIAEAVFVYNRYIVPFV